MPSAPDDHRTMIGLPATDRTGWQRAHPTLEEEYNAYMAQMRASGIPSSTMPSAAHSTRSLEQHPNAQTLNNENPHFGVFEPWDPSSSANVSSPAQPSASGYAHQQPYASPPDFGPAGFSFPTAGRSLDYPSYPSPTRPEPYVGGGDQAWQPRTGFVPSSSLIPISGNGSSVGSHFSGGGGGTGGAYAGSSGGYSTGSNPAAQQRPTVGLNGGPGRPRSVGGGNATRYQHTHSQSGDGLLAPPRPNKRPHIAAEEDDESSKEDGNRGVRGGQQNAVKRL
ncbi:hypothetical protein FRC12_021844 [Ceratobasidium sp. 428]|nr:hypothetical protein FRC12_021844 [Ceratobasidium sp. 428]